MSYERHMVFAMSLRHHWYVHLWSLQLW